MSDPVLSRPTQWTNAATTSGKDAYLDSACREPSSEIRSAVMFLAQKVAANIQLRRMACGQQPEVIYLCNASHVQDSVPIMPHIVMGKVTAPAWFKLRFSEGIEPFVAPPLTHRLQREQFLEQVYAADAQNLKERTLDLIFEWFDDQFQGEHFAECDTLFDQVNVSRLSVRALIGILSITLNLKANLARRGAFLNAVRSRLTHERPNDVVKLLRGLE